MQTNVLSPAVLLRAPHRISLADEMYEQIKQDVYNFKLVPGDRFTETKISERLGLSRTLVRQALFRLQHEGFVKCLLAPTEYFPPVPTEYFPGSRANLLEAGCV